MPPAPGNAELMRRLDEVVTRLDKLADRLEDGFVRKDVYAADRQTDAVHMAGIEQEIQGVHRKVDNITNQRDAERDKVLDQLQAQRRWVIGLVITVLLTPAGTILVTRLLG